MKKLIITIITSLIVIAGICLPIFASDKYEVLTEKPTDLTGIKWAGNDTMQYPGEKQYSVNFNCYVYGGIEESRNSFKFERDSDRDLPLICITVFNTGLGYYANGGRGASTMNIAVDTQNGASKEFTFTGGTDATNSELIDWLWSNGTMYGIKQESLVSKIINYIDIGTTENVANTPIIPGHNYSLGTLTYHTVAFNNNGHGIAPESQMVREGYKVSQPSDLSEDGWIFNGWFSDKDCTNEFDFNSDIEESKILYAKWDAATIQGNYVGYYADVDNNGTVDGVIFFDYTQGADTTSGFLGNGVAVDAKTEGLASYELKTVGGHDNVVVKTSAGDDRFYVIALEDSKPTSNDDYPYWYYSAYANKISDYAGLTSTAFGSGKQNTQTMKSKWNSQTYGGKNNSDMWSIDMGDWFVPSKDEWSVLGSNLKKVETGSYSKTAAFPSMTFPSGATLGFCPNYWSSSVYSATGAWGVIFFGSTVGSGDFNINSGMRLASTF